MKQISGGDQLSARFLHGEFFEFKPTSKIVIVTNNHIRFSSHNDAMWARLVQVPFTVRIPDAEQDPHLKTKLLAESPGILNWIVEGAQVLRGQVRGTGERASVDFRGSGRGRHSADLRRRTNPQKDRRKLAASRLYNDYLTWCKLGGQEAVRQTTFKKDLSSRFEFVQRREGKGVFWQDVTIQREY